MMPLVLQMLSKKAKIPHRSHKPKRREGHLGDMLPPRSFRQELEMQDGF